MRKWILSLVMTLLLVPCVCCAEPVITSDTRTFDVMKGIYDLRGHVFVQFPVHDSTMTITGDKTQVYMYQMEVHGAGNITLSFDDMHFSCDKVDVYHKERTAYLAGRMKFKSNDVSITSNKGSYCWKTKLATFIGNVKVNGQPRPDNTKYNMETKQFVP